MSIAVYLLIGVAAIAFVCSAAFAVYMIRAALNYLRHFRW
jgi:hypothetical protein